MTDLEALVIEWRDARQATMMVNWERLSPDELRSHTRLWVRLGDAESALMARARQIVSKPAITWDQWAAPDEIPPNLRCGPGDSQ